MFWRLFKSHRGVDADCCFGVEQEAGVHVNTTGAVLDSVGCPCQPEGVSSSVFHFSFFFSNSTALIRARIFLLLLSDASGNEGNRNNSSPLHQIAPTPPSLNIRTT